MNNLLKKCIIPLLLCIFVVPGCARQQLSPQTEFIMGTVCTINLYEKGTRRIYQRIFNRLREIDLLMSANMAETQIEKINGQAGIAPVKVHKDVITVIEKALHFAEISNGSFDPTIGPIVKLWGIGFDYEHLPRQDEIDAILPLINWRDVQIDKQSNTVFLRRPGMGLDLGSIAKGYAADEAARIIREARIPGAIIDLGGNVFAFGVKQNNRPWVVGIQDPSGRRGSYIGVVELKNKTIVTSGVYERYFEQDGKRYHHLFNPKDGYPAENGLLSVTIITDHSIDADALSTCIFVMGYEKGKALVDSIDNAEALFIFEDFTIKGTAGAMEHFTLTDNSFTLVP